MAGKNVRKVISMVLVLLMSFSSMVFATGGDYLGHWAEDSIQTWIDKGYVNGYPDGSFKPENDITRAEFISIVNRAFEFTKEEKVSFSDVDESHWAYNEFKRVSAEGYMVGYENGTFGHKNKITRAELASVLATLLNLNAAKDSHAFLDLADFEDVVEWSAGSVSAVVDNGYMKLRYGNTFAPKSPATRAEVIDALNKGYLSVAKVVYDEAGTYTAGVVDGSVMINAKAIILEDTTINGNLVIGEGVGNGDVTLNNVTVKGNTIVKGGGMDSIIIIDSAIANLIVEKKDGKVRILAKGATFVRNVDMKSGGKLESSDLKESNFGRVVIAENLISTEPIILAGNFNNLEVKSGKNEIKVLVGKIKDFIIAKTAKNLKVNLAEGVEVEILEINAEAQIDGKGEIETAIVNADDVKMTVSVETTRVADGIKVVGPVEPEEPEEPVEPTDPVVTVVAVTAVSSTELEVTLSDNKIYDVTLTEVLVDGVETQVTFTINKKEYTAKVTWNKAIGMRTVETVETFADIEVEYGGGYDLPKEVEITLSDDEVVTVPVEWDETEVDTEIVGTYVVEGRLDLAGGMNIEATDKVATVNIVLADYFHQTEPIAERPFREEYEKIFGMMDEGIIIAGLEDNYVPQAIAYIEDEDLLVTTHHDNTKKKPTVLAFTSKETGELVKYLGLYLSEGEMYNGHAGGVAVSEKYIWVASGEKLHKFSIKEAMEKKSGENLILESIHSVHTRASFIGYNAETKTMFAGEFSLEDSHKDSGTYKTDTTHHMKNRDGVQYKSVTLGYELENDEFPESGQPSFALSHGHRVQGISLTENQIYLSHSYGRANNGILGSYKNVLGEAQHDELVVDGESVPLWFLDSQSQDVEEFIPSMSEGIVEIDGKLHIIFESAATKYLTATSRYALDRVQILDLEKFNNLRDEEELKVESVSAINATTLSVTLSDDSTHVVTLEEALEANVPTEVTFIIGGVEYAATVTWEEVTAPAEDTFTVTFNSNGGSDVKAITEITSGSAITLPAVPTKDGSTFVGWYKEAGFTTEFTNKTPITEDITVHAKWEESSVELTVEGILNLAKAYDYGEDYVYTRLCN